MIICNCRNLSATLTGVQRYTTEILGRAGERIGRIEPGHALVGSRGHIWEQTVLPFLLGGNLLWSPSNTGPILVERQVVSIMDLSPLDHPEWTSPAFSRLYRTIIPILVKRVRAIITISEFSRHRILDHFPFADGKVYVTPLAADKRFRPASAFEKQSVAKMLDLPNRPYILALGSLEPRKNLRNLIHAWKCLSNGLRKDVSLIIAGAIGRREIFGEQKLLPVSENVVFLGHVSDELLPALYSGALATIYVSMYEGFGLPALEAMSCGCPVIVSNTTSLPEVIGDSGVSVDPACIESIAGAITNIVNDSALRKRLSVMGLNRSKEFSWQKTFEMTWKVLERVASE